MMIKFREHGFGRGFVSAGYSGGHISFLLFFNAPLIVFSWGPKYKYLALVQLGRRWDFSKRSRQNNLRLRKRLGL